MADILTKLQMVCDKIGVTETAHTIEEQIDLIIEHLDAVPNSTNIAEALDDLSDVANKINNDEVYIEKTITANGTYNARDDEATAYSKVVVNVQPPAPEPTYTVVTFSGEGTEQSPYVPAYEANKFYTRSGAGTTESPYVYTKLTSGSKPVSWGAADTFYTQDA